MTLKNQMTTDISTLISVDDFAQTISYTAVGQASVNIKAQVIRAAVFQEPYVRGKETAKAEIFVSKADVMNPQFGDTVTFDSKTWEIDPSGGVAYEDDYIYKIKLERRLT